MRWNFTDDAENIQLPSEQDGIGRVNFIMAQHDLGVLSNEEAGELLRHHFRIDPQSVEEDNRWLDENASDEDRWRAEMLLESTIFEEWKMFCDDPTVDPADFEPRDE